MGAVIFAWRRSNRKISFFMILRIGITPQVIFELRDSLEPFCDTQEFPIDDAEYYLIAIAKLDSVTPQPLSVNKREGR